MRDAGLTSAPVALDYRQQRFTTRLANACEGLKLKEVHDHPTASVRICKVIRKDHERGREAETMCWPSPDEEPAVKMVILSHKTAAKREGRRLARERVTKVGAEVRMWWTNGLRSDGGRVVGATVCKYRNGGKAFSCHLGTGRVEVYDAELWVIVLALRESVKKRDTLQTHRVTKVAVFSGSEVAIR
jgi:hypothetical protein